MKHEMRVGSIVTAVKPFYFRSGCESYDFAICVQVDPLRLVSRDTAMLWANVKKEEVEVTGTEAAPGLLADCLKRLENYKERSMGIEESKKIMESKMGEVDRQKIVDLAFRTGVLLGSIGDDQVKSWMAVNGFNPSQQEELKELLRKLALLFYK